MANIKNKFTQPLSTEFSPKDLVVDIKNGHLYYKSNLGVHKLIGDNLSTDTEEGDIWQSGISNIISYTKGNVGIGTTTPGEALEIEGNISASGDIHVSSISASGDIHGSMFISSGSDSNEGGQVSLLPKIGGDYTWHIDNYQENFRLFAQSASQADVRMQIEGTTGRVGIGTTSPDYPLEVKKANDNSYITQIYNSSDGSAGATKILRLRTGDATQASTTYIGFVNGDNTLIASITGATGNTISVNESSDRRLKTNIKDCDFTIDDLDKILMRSYTKGGVDNKIGVIAQELLNTPFKWMVQTGIKENKANNLKEGDDGYQYMQVGYNHFTPLLIKSVQDANKMIKELQQELKILKKKING